MPGAHHLPAEWGSGSGSAPEPIAQQGQFDLQKCRVAGCGEIFPDRASLADHQSSHSGHKSAASDSALVIRGKTANKKRPCQCPKCPKTFVGLYELRRHFGRKHSLGEKEHGCRKCGKRFFVAVDLRDHVKSCGQPGSGAGGDMCVCGIRFTLRCNLTAHRRTCPSVAAGSTHPSGQVGAGISPIHPIHPGPAVGGQSVGGYVVGGQDPAGESQRQAPLLAQAVHLSVSQGAWHHQGAPGPGASGMLRPQTMGSAVLSSDHPMGQASASTMGQAVGVDHPMGQATVVASTMGDAMGNAEMTGPVVGGAPRMKQAVGGAFPMGPMMTSSPTTNHTLATMAQAVPRALGMPAQQMHGPSPPSLLGSGRGRSGPEGQGQVGRDYGGHEQPGGVDQGGRWRTGQEPGELGLGGQEQRGQLTLGGDIAGDIPEALWQPPAGPYRVGTAPESPQQVAATSQRPPLGSNSPVVSTSSSPAPPLALSTPGTPLAHSDAPARPLVRSTNSRVPSAGGHAELSPCNHPSPAFPLAKSNASAPPLAHSSAPSVPLVWSNASAPPHGPSNAPASPLARSASSYSLLSASGSSASGGIALGRELAGLPVQTPPTLAVQPQVEAPPVAGSSGAAASTPAPVTSATQPALGWVGSGGKLTSFSPRRRQLADSAGHARWGGGRGSRPHRLQVVLQAQRMKPRLAPREFSHPQGALRTLGDPRLQAAAIAMMEGQEELRQRNKEEMRDAVGSALASARHGMAAAQKILALQAGLDRLSLANQSALEDAVADASVLQTVVEECAQAILKGTAVQGTGLQGTTSQGGADAGEGAGGGVVNGAVGRVGVMGVPGGGNGAVGGVRGGDQSLHLSHLGGAGLQQAHGNMPAVMAAAAAGASGGHEVSIALPSPRSGRPGDHPGDRHSGNTSADNNHAMMGSTPRMAPLPPLLRRATPPPPHPHSRGLTPPASPGFADNSSMAAAHAVTISGPAASLPTTMADAARSLAANVVEDMGVAGQDNATVTVQIQMMASASSEALSTEPSSIMADASTPSLDMAGKGGGATEIPTGEGVGLDVAGGMGIEGGGAAGASTLAAFHPGGARSLAPVPPHASLMMGLRGHGAPWLRGERDIAGGAASPRGPVHLDQGTDGQLRMSAPLGMPISSALANVAMTGGGAGIRYSVADNSPFLVADGGDQGAVIMGTDVGGTGVVGIEVGGAAAVSTEPGDGGNLATAMLITESNDARALMSPTSISSSIPQRALPPLRMPALASSTCTPPFSPLAMGAVDHVGAFTLAGDRGGATSTLGGGSQGGDRHLGMVGGRGKPASLHGYSHAAAAAAALTAVIAAPSPRKCALQGDGAAGVMQFDLPFPRPGTPKFGSSNTPKFGGSSNSGAGLTPLARGPQAGLLPSGFGSADVTMGGTAEPGAKYHDACGHSEFVAAFAGSSGSAGRVAAYTAGSTSFMATYAGGGDVTEAAVQGSHLSGSHGGTPVSIMALSSHPPQVGQQGGVRADMAATHPLQSGQQGAEPAFPMPLARTLSGGGGMLALGADNGLMSGHTGPTRARSLLGSSGQEPQGGLHEGLGIWGGGVQPGMRVMARQGAVVGFQLPERSLQRSLQGSLECSREGAFEGAVEEATKSSRFLQSGLEQSLGGAGGGHGALLSGGLQSSLEATRTGGAREVDAQSLKRCGAHYSVESSVPISGSAPNLSHYADTSRMIAPPGDDSTHTQPHTGSVSGPGLMTSQGNPPMTPQRCHHPSGDLPIVMQEGTPARALAQVVDIDPPARLLAHIVDVDMLAPSAQVAQLTPAMPSLAPTTPSPAPRDPRSAAYTSMVELLMSSPGSDGGGRNIGSDGGGGYVGLGSRGADLGLAGGEPGSLGSLSHPSHQSVETGSGGPAPDASGYNGDARGGGHLVLLGPWARQPRCATRPGLWDSRGLRTWEGGNPRRG
eukprot:jgi/Mesvir1/13597/Mv06781-RA.1